jgi:hypothetical protein
MTARQIQRAAESGGDLRRAFDEAAEFAASLARLQPPDISCQVGQDLATGTVAVDECGLSPGAYAAAVAPAQHLLQRWRALRAVFLATLEPKRADIDAVQAFPQAVADLRTKRAADIERLRARWAEGPRNTLVAQQWKTAQAVFEQESLRHGQRLATMTAYSPLYWIALLMIGVAEWLINYDTFLVFTGVIAIAAGATVILGVLLTFAAHGHGELLKQWSYRFGRFQTRQSRVGSWRMLALATFAVLIVLAAAGGSRYSAVLRNLSQTRQPDLIGGGYQLDFNPLRDVLLSLLANVAAWAVGVFISYFCHDVDPDFMAATYQHRRCGREFFRARKRLEDETQVIVEHTDREVGAMENGALARRASTEKERAMLTQIEQHNLAVLETLLAWTRTEVRRYRASLVQRSQAQAAPTAIVMKRPDGGFDTLTPELYIEVPLIVDRGLLEQVG